MPKRKPLLFLGAGTGAVSYAKKFRDDPKYEIVGYVQDTDPEMTGQDQKGLRVYGVEEAINLRSTHAVIACMGSRKGRPLIERFEEAGFEFATVIAGNAVVHTVDIEPGCFIGELAILDPYTKIGAHTLISARVLVGHDTVIGRHSFIGAGTTFGGGSVVGEGCFIGIGSVIRDHLRIGEGATVGAGSVVVRDVEPGSTVVGNPARLISSGVYHR